MYGFNFNVFHLISLALFSSNFAFSFDFGALNNLGDQINRHVTEKLAPLQGLGARISANIHRQLSGLDHLGEQIQQSVYEGLEPVRALEIKLKMKNGVGGTTIQHFVLEGKTFVILNRQKFTCDGTISEDGKCSRPLKPFQVREKKDHCYSNEGFSQVNDKICIGASSVVVINDNIICESSSDTPALVLTVGEYNKLCGEPRTIEYKYIADPLNPFHVNIPNENKHVKCSNNQPGVCTFSETNSLRSNGNVVINTGSTVVL